MYVTAKSLTVTNSNS